MRCSGVLLDIDNTIYDYDAPHTAALAELFSRLSLDLGIEGAELRAAFSEARTAIHIELSETAASHNRLLYLQRMFELLGLNPLPHTLGAYNIYWDTFLARMELFDGVLPLLEQLRQLGIGICFVTDLTAHIQFRKIERLGLQQYGAHLVTSEEAGREKPHPYLFLLGLKKLGLKAADVCMVGDSFEKDILGATKLGIRSFWLNRQGKKIPLPALVTEISSFCELHGHLHG